LLGFEQGVAAPPAVTIHIVAAVQASSHTCDTNSRLSGVHFFTIARTNPVTILKALLSPSSLKSCRSGRQMLRLLSRAGSRWH
jgi:hypothetical protein